MTVVWQLYTTVRHNTHGTNTNMQRYTNLLHNTHGTNTNTQLHTNLLHNIHGTNTNMQLYTNLRHNTHGPNTHIHLIHEPSIQLMAAGCLHDLYYGTTTLWRAVPFSMSVLLQVQWQWGGTPIGLSVKLTRLGQPNKSSRFLIQNRSLLATT